MAETPPPYGPRKKSNTTTIVFIVLIVCAVCCIIGVVGVAGAGFLGFKKIKNMTACAIGFAEAGKALESYADDHNGKLPDANKWQDEVRPYFAKQLKKDEDQGVKVFGSFDPEGQWTCTDDSGGQPTGIAFNSDLSGQKVSDIKNKSTTVLLYEVPKTGTNLNAPYTELTKSSSPKIMGSPRGWFKVNANFEPDSTGNKNIKFSD